MKAVLSVVIPVYNEEEALFVSYKRLREAVSGIGSPYELIFVNDGSRDKTPDILNKISDADKTVRIVTFSRNFGHMAAISAGMDFSVGDAVVVIDADMQDPPEIIPKMFEKWREGYEVVYGKRSKRKGETIFKKVSASVYYRLLKRLSNIDIPVDTGEFRLIDRKVCDVIKSLSEHGRYMRGLISWVGFRQCSVEFVREERIAGSTKYSLKKMIELSISGITAFSTKPLRLAAFIGAVLCLAGFIWLIVLLSAGQGGWQAVAGLLLLTQGMILAAIGIAGEYLGRVYEEAKNRPGYIVKETKGFPVKE